MKRTLRRTTLRLICIAAMGCEIVIAAMPTLAGCGLAYLFARMFTGR